MLRFLFDCTRSTAPIQNLFNVLKSLGEKSNGSLAGNFTGVDTDTGVVTTRGAEIKLHCTDGLWVCYNFQRGFVELGELDLCWASASCFLAAASAAARLSASLCCRRFRSLSNCSGSIGGGGQW